MKKIEVSIIKTVWLDLSESWFLTVNGVKIGGELTSFSEAEKNGKLLAKLVNGVFVN